MLRACTILFAFAVVAWTNDAAGADKPQLREQNLYSAGEGDYHSYRIPALLVSPRGTLLAFAEGRKNSRSDAGDIDLVLRRSTDGGRSWSPLQVVWSDGEHTCGNPCPVVDRKTGTIWLLMTWNDGRTSERDIQPGFGRDSRRVFVTHSRDDGATWTKPREITADVKHKSWSWFATGPGAGIQMEQGPHRGRMVIPCDHKIPTADGRKFKSHVIYSDDHGQTWRRGGSSPRDQVNECEVVELAGGRLLLNMRNYDKQDRSRQVCFSDDGGATWRDQRHDPTLIAPTCQASIRRFRWPQADQPGVVLFSNPASRSRRERLTVRASYDDCQTWPHARVLYSGGSAYSSLAALPGGTVGCLYEKDGYRHIALAEFSLGWISSGEAAEPGN